MNDYDIDVEMEIVPVKVPKGSTVLVVLAYFENDLFCGSFDTPEETIRHLRAAADKIQGTEL